MAKRPDQFPRRRLLVVNPTSLLGGAELVLQRMLDALPDGEWHVTAAIPEGALADRVRERGLTVIPIPDLKLPSGPRLVAVARAFGRAVRAASRLRRAHIRSDAVVVNGVLALPAVRLARPRSPVILLVHDVLDRVRFRVVLRLFGGGVDLAVAPSEAAARSLRDRGLPTRVVPNGTPWPVPPAPPEPPVPPVVGELAALTPLKGQDVLLAAIARLPRRDVIVELAGEALPKDGPYVERLRALSHRSGLEGRTRFLGRVEDPLERLRGWSIAVLPSVGQESFGLAVLEAMSVGVPVIATNHGGPPEILGDAGLLVAPGDAEALSVAIGRLLDDADLRDRCRAAGPRLVAGAYTLERQQAVLLSVLRDALSDRAPRSTGAAAR
jgi:glycosyltransferase involved in cell wall biosynthesis